MGLNNGMMFGNASSASNAGNLNGPTSQGSSGQILISQGGSPATWRQGINLPTVQAFKSVGTTTGALFQVTTGASAAAGAVYGNNGATYTVATAFNGVTFLFTTGGGSLLSGGTLQLLSGFGSSGIGFTNTTTLGTYVTPTSFTPLYIRLKMVGGGGGSAGGAGNGGGSSGVQGGNAGPSVFGSNLLIAVGGAGGSGGATLPLGTGGPITLNAGPIDIASRAGTMGQPGMLLQSTGYASGGNGGQSPFGGAGAGSGSQMAPSAPVANTGSGGGGGGASSGGASSSASGGGGGAGGYIEAFITSPGATYLYSIGAGGSQGTTGTGGYAGVTGSLGYLVVEEFYQ